MWIGLKYTELKIDFNMGILTYKGLEANIGYNEESGVLYGKIEGIDELVEFEGETVAEITEEFHREADIYLARR